MAESIVIRVSGNVKDYQDSLKKVQAQSKDLEDQLASIAKKSAIAFAAFAGTIGLAVNEFRKFDDSIRGVKTLLDETSFGAKGLEKGFSDMKKEALALATEVPIEFDKINKSLFDTVSAGVDASGAVKFLGVSARLATAGLTDVSIATDGMTSAMNAFEFEAKDAEKIASKFFTAQKFGKTTIEELAGGLGLAAANAKAAGVSFDELLASVAAATTAGIRTKAAFTGVKAVLANISKPTADAKEEAKRLGIEFNAAALRSQGLEKFLDNLKTSANFTKDSIIKLFGSTEAQGIAFALTGTQGKAFKKTLEELKNEQKALTTFQNAYEVQSKSLDKQLLLLSSGFKAVSVQIGAAFAPAITAIVEQMTKLVKVFAENEELKKWTAIILAVGAALSGAILVLTTFGIVMLKVRTTFILFNSTFAVGAKIIKVWNFIVGVGTKVLKLFRLALNSSLGPISLIIAGVTLLAFVFKDELIAAFEDAQVIVPAVLGFIGNIVVGWAKNLVEIFKNIAKVYLGIFTLDTDLIEEGLKGVTNAVTEGFGDAAREATDEFNKEMDEGFAELNAKRAAAAAEAAEKEKAALERGNEEKIQIEDKKNTEIITKQKEAGKERVRVAAEVNTQLVDAEKAFILDFLLEGKNISDSRIASIKQQHALETQLENVQNQKFEKLLTDKVKAEQDIRDKKFTKAEEDLIKKNFKEEAIQKVFDDKFVQALRLKLNSLEVENKEFDIREAERRAELREELIAENEEFGNLRDDQQEEFLNKNVERQLSDEELMREVREEASQQQLDDKRRLNKQLLKDQIKFGKSFAEINRVLNSEEVQGVKDATSELTQLQSSRNSTLKAIGKIAAVAQITIKTAESAMNIYAGFSTIPIIGPTLGAIGAAAAVAFGAERISRVTAAAQGGVMVGGVPGVDSIPALLSPGEIVAPEKNFDEVVNSVADSRIRNDEAESSAPTAQVEITMNDNLVEFVEAQIVERQQAGISLLEKGVT